MEVLEGIKMEVRNNINSVSLRSNSSPSFGGYVHERNMRQAVYKYSKGAQKVLQSLGKNNGENLNNIVTAVGTSAVAPIFIRYNPISHEDKDTRAYSAWRQPISAVIALAVQLPVMTAYNKWLDSHATNLGIDEMDLSAKPRASVLKPLVKQEYKKYRDEMVRQGLEPEKKAEWIENRILHYQDQAFYKELKKLRETMDISKIDDFDLVKPEEYKSAKKDVFKEVLKKLGFSDSEISQFKDQEDFKKHGKKIIKSKNKTYSEIAEKIEEAAKERAVENVNKQLKVEADVKFKTSQLFNEMLEKIEAEKVSIYQSVGDKDTDPLKITIKEAEEKIAKVKENIYATTLTDLKDELKTLEKESPEYRTVERAIEKLTNNKKVDNIKNHGGTLEDVMKSVKIKKWLKSKINYAEEKLSQWKKVSGIVVGLAILPITCGLLNWAYPRIMERYFPELTAKKKAKVAAKKQQAMTGKEAK